MTEDLESAGEVLRKPSKGKPKTAKLSNEYLALLGRILNKFGAVYRTDVADLIPAWRSALSDLTPRALEVGALETLKRHKDFMPTPAQFRGYTEEALSRMDAPKGAHVDCEICRGTGWKVVKRADGQGNCAVRCDGASEG